MHKVMATLWRINPSFTELLQWLIGVNQNDESVAWGHSMTHITTSTLIKWHCFFLNLKMKPSAFGICGYKTSDCKKTGNRLNYKKHSKWKCHLTNRGSLWSWKHKKYGLASSRGQNDIINFRWNGLWFLTVCNWRLLTFTQSIRHKTDEKYRVNRIFVNFDHFWCALTRWNDMKYRDRSPWGQYIKCIRTNQWCQCTY